jgi:hypothetical protein
MGIAIVGLSVAPAYADGITYSANGGAYAGWVSNGDRLDTCDEKKDGHAGVAKIWVKGENPEYQGADWAYRGAGTCLSVSRSWIPEGTTVRMQACLGNDYVIDESTCGPIRTDHA